jgi:hypothetical protein
VHVAHGVVADGLVGTDGSSSKVVSVLAGTDKGMVGSVEVGTGVSVTLGVDSGVVGMDAGNVVSVSVDLVGMSVLVEHVVGHSVGVMVTFVPDVSNTGGMVHAVSHSVSVGNGSSVVVESVVLEVNSVSVSVESSIELLMADSHDVVGMVVSLTPDVDNTVGMVVSSAHFVEVVDGSSVVSESLVLNSVPGVVSSEPVFHDMMGALVLVGGNASSVSPDSHVVVSSLVVLVSVDEDSVSVGCVLLGVEVSVDSVVSVSVELGVLSSESLLLSEVVVPVASGVEEAEVHLGGGLDLGSEGHGGESGS